MVSDRARRLVRVLEGAVETAAFYPDVDSEVVCEEREALLRYIERLEGLAPRVEDILSHTFCPHCGAQGWKEHHVHCSLKYFHLVYDDAQG